MGDYNSPEEWKKDYNESSGINKWIIIIPILVIIVIVGVFLVFFNSPKSVEKLAVEQQESSLKVTNAGDKPIEKGALKVYMDDKPLQVTNSEAIQPGQSTNLDLSNAEIKENSVLEIRFGSKVETIRVVPISTTTSIPSTTTTSTIVTSSSTMIITTSTTTQATSTTLQPTTTIATTTTIGIIDCGEGRWDLVNWDCMITASQNCDKAKIRPNLTLEIFGTISTSRGYYELQGMDVGKCILYVKGEYYDFVYTNATIQTLLNQNMTLQQIYAQESSIRQQVKSKEGTDGTCKFEKNNLTALFVRWKGGQLSSEDYKGAGCQGLFFANTSY